MSGIRSVLRRLVTHDVTTGESPAYPDLEPLELSLGPPAAYAATLAAARDMPGWTIVDADEAGRRIHAEARTPRLGFVDDVRARVMDRPGGGSCVRVRSTSRIGLYDFGTNARRIREFLHRVALRAGP